MTALQLRRTKSLKQRKKINSCGKVLRGIMFYAVITLEFSRVKGKTVCVYSNTGARTERAGGDHSWDKVLTRGLYPRDVGCSLHNPSSSSLCLKFLQNTVLAGDHYSFQITPSWGRARVALISVAGEGGRHEWHQWH